MLTLTKLKQVFFVVILAFISLILLAGIIIAIVLYERSRPPYCNVAVVNLTGVLVTSIDPTDTTDEQISSDQVDQQLEIAKNNPHIKAIVLNVDSPGGSPIAGEDMMKELQSIINKPTVALARTEDDSGAYMASTGADTIFASDVSGVGDIGVTSSFTDNSIKDQQDRITFNQISIGKYKDMGDQDKPVTADEKALMLSQAQEVYNVFVQIVSTNRHIPLAITKKLADGAEYEGTDALTNGLIDHIGDMLNVQQYLTQKLGKKVVICQ